MHLAQQFFRYVIISSDLTAKHSLRLCQSPNPPNAFVMNPTMPQLREGTLNMSVSFRGLSVQLWIFRKMIGYLFNLFILLSVCLIICLFLSVFLSVFLSYLFNLFILLSVCLIICLFVSFFLSVFLSYFTLLNKLSYFANTCWLFPNTCI